MVNWNFVSLIMPDDGLTLAEEILAFSTTGSFAENEIFLALVIPPVELTPYTLIYLLFGLLILSQKDQVLVLPLSVYFKPLSEDAGIS